MKQQKQHQVGRWAPANVAFNVFNYTVLVFLSLICLYPILYVLFASVSDPMRLTAHRGLLVKPLGFTMRGYQVLMKDKSILTGYRNTLVYVVLGTIVNMVMTIMGAYSLSRPNLMLKKPMMMMITVTMFFSGGLVPWYLTMRQIGVYNNIWAMILPTAIGTWNMVILRTGFQSVPRELEEAALIDGASQFRILKDVIIPLSKPVLAVILLYYTVEHWNAWFNAMVLLTDKSRYPLQLKLRELLVLNSTQAAAVDTSVSEVDSYRELIKYCVIVVATVPILCIYPFLQKYFVKGVMVGSLKG